MKIWKNKYFWWSVIGVFAWTWVSNWMIHGKILQETYMQTASLWRTQDDMKDHFMWIILGQFLISFWMCWIFPYGFKNEGSWEGLRFGMWIGFFSAAHTFIQYAVVPIPMNLMWAQCLLTIAQSMIAGWVVWKVWTWNPQAMNWSRT